MTDRKWAIYSKNGTPITIKMNTENGVVDMKYYANKEAATTALNMMSPKDRLKYGASIREVAQS